MTLAELNTLLRATGYPVAYSHFKTAVSAPFIVYHVTNNPHFIADNKVYHKIDSIDIELYTDIKDLKAEAALENLLDQAEIPYTAYPQYIQEEQLHQKIYEVRLF